LDRGTSGKNTTRFTFNSGLQLVFNSCVTTLTQPRICAGCGDTPSAFLYLRALAGLNA
jgi:hypothetical protein